jgi:hypothetical protein
MESVVIQLMLELLIFQPTSKQAVRRKSPERLCGKFLLRLGWCHTFHDSANLIIANLSPRETMEKSGISAAKPLAGPDFQATLPSGKILCLEPPWFPADPAFYAWSGPPLV